MRTKNKNKSFVYGFYTACRYSSFLLRFKITVLLLFLYLHFTMADKCEKEADTCDKVVDKVLNVGSMVRTDSEAMRSSDRQPKPTEPSDTKTLEDMGYKFNDRGQLRTVDSDEPFVFKISEDNEINQKNYETLGEVITSHVYSLLESQAHLKKMPVPVDAKQEHPQGFIFMTEDALTNPNKLMVLIHGSGVVRAGQWARRLIINDNLSSGTQLPFIERAVEQGYGVLLMNTNQNSVEHDGKDEPIKGSESAEQHAVYVWENYVQKAAAKRIAVIAHSYGGIATVEAAKALPESFLDRVFAICFTDSVHNLHHQRVTSQLREFLLDKAINWVSSDKPVGTPITDDLVEVVRISAGHPKHEMTSWSAFDSIFEHLAHQCKEDESCDCGV